MLRSAIVTLMLAGLATVAAAETVYKWVDAGGQVHYTDRPPTESGAKLIGVYERELLLEEDEPAAPDGGPAADEEPAEPTPASTSAAVERDVAQARSAQCKQAQERYKNYVESQRLFRQTPDGKREYLSDAELAQARIDARKAVDEFCQ